MSAYEYNTLTQDGATLIAQATAANPIVFVASKSKASAATDADDLAGKPLSWYDGKSGTIASCSAYVDDAGNPIARIIAAYTNAGSTQIAKSVCITARLASQTDADAVVFAAISDPDATIELPGSGSIASLVEFPFNISINATNTVTVTPGSSASVADLERFVSLHSAGNPNTGDNQTIRGEKTFTSAAHFQSNDGTVTIENADVLAPNGDVLADHVEAVTIQCEDFSVVNNGSISAEKNISAGGNLLAGGNASISGNVSCENIDCVVIDASDDIYANNGSVTAISLIASQDISIGSGFSANYLGTVSAKEVVADYIRGVLPCPEASGIEPSIGGILYIGISGVATGTFYKFGQVFDGSQSTIKSAAWNVTASHYEISASSTALSGKYKSLMDAYSGSSTNIFVLAMRIE